jgi:ferredoxin-type protein NapF
MSRRAISPRFIARFVFLVAASATFLLPFSRYGIAKYIVQASPFISICSTIALRKFAIGALVGFALLFIVAFNRRWFCRCVCPAGLLLEGTVKIGAKKVSWWTCCPSIGKYIAVITFLSALIGYPLLLWMDPLAIISGSFAVRSGTALLSGLLPSLLFILSFISGSLWCSRLCPLGGMQELLFSFRSLFRKENQSSQSFLPERRKALICAAGFGVGVFINWRGMAIQSRTPIRPPGAAAKGNFAGLCIRCGNCIRACPSKIIHPDVSLGRVAGFLAPKVSFDKDYCREDCNACTLACPSGALKNVSLEQKPHMAIGKTVMTVSRCLLALEVKDCNACQQSCPYKAISIFWDEELYVAYPRVDSSKCNGCGACQLACPTTGDKAIRVIPL